MHYFDEYYGRDKGYILHYYLTQLLTTQYDRNDVKKQEKTNAFRFNGATRYQSTQTFFRKRGGRT